MLCAPVADAADPVKLDRAESRAGLTARDDPVDAFQAQARQRPEQRLQ